jgi:hypothetical protein
MHRNLSIQRIVFSFTMAMLLIMQTSCFRNYYKIAKQPVIATPESISTLKNDNRYFVLRSGTYAWYMNNISLSNDQKTIRFDLANLPEEHRLHLRRGEHHENFQYKRDRPTRVVLSEVHFFIPEDPSISNGPYTLALSKVQKIEVIEKDGGRTAGSFIGGTFAILGSIAAGVLIIAALTSCPFVSPYDGKEFSLQGEIYGGAVYPQLSRNDYIKLNMAPTPLGNLQLKISNELKEVQHTDLAELITIDHSNNVTILPDQEGNLYSIKDPLPANSALTKNNTNVTGLLADKDSRVMEFNDSISENGCNEVVLQFSKPSHINKGKLVLTVKNTFWLDRLYGKMLEGFGNYYNTFVKNQKNQTAETLNKWTDEQQIPLKVSVKTKEGWKPVTGLKTSGPVAYRDVVVPIDLSGIDEPFTEIKLSSGFMFWEINYAAIDYSENEIFSIEKQFPAMATDETGKIVSHELSAPDGNYLIQPVPGNVTTITYNYHQPSEGQSQTYILHSKGWYETKREFKGKPNIVFLEQFKKPMAFPKFSLELYKKEQSLQETTAKK